MTALGGGFNRPMQQPDWRCASNQLALRNFLVAPRKAPSRAEATCPFAIR